jgi:hypothetical protein
MTCIKRRNGEIMANITNINPKQPNLAQAILNKLLQPIRNYLDGIEIGDRELAKWLCELIPAQCPFERDVTLFGRKLFHIPPMCKLNPLYYELMGLRFRALSFLADECGEDVTAYC